MRFTLNKFLVAAAVAATTSSAAYADMGLAPVGPNGTYVSIEGGYLHQNGPDVIGHGITTTAGAFQNVLVSPESGYFIGGMIGFANAQPYLPPLPFHRFEIYGHYGEADDEITHRTPGVGSTLLKSVDGTASAAAGTFGQTEIERQTWEAGMRFEYDQRSNATSTNTWVIAPFLRHSDEDTRSVVQGLLCPGVCPPERTAGVDTWMYGVMFAVEPEWKLSDGIALVTRAGVGVYGYDADGTFRSFSDKTAGDPFAASLSDDDSGIGFRGQLGVALKFLLGLNTHIETFAEADYFSDVGTAGLADNNPAAASSSSVETDDLWELRAGARLTIGLGGTQ
ncbi:MAG: hypothetical protein ACRCS9_06275 [Hyphomicrobium sp.]